MTTTFNRVEVSASFDTVIIGGIRIGTQSRAEWTCLIASECLRRRENRECTLPAFFTSANGNVLSQHASSLGFRKIIDEADGIDADGMSLVFASRLVGEKRIRERCSTTDFFHDMAAAAIKVDLSFYLLGGTTEINQRATRELAQMYPGLKIVGNRCGYFSVEEEKSLVEEINDAAPDILWVGLGVPKEHEFVARNRRQLTHVGAIKTCGGLFDFLSGERRRAPRMMRDIGFEWLFRLIQEPGRLWHRYLFTNIHALYLIVFRSA